MWFKMVSGQTLVSVALLSTTTSWATITGSGSCSKGMCITGMHDDTNKTDTYTLQLSGSSFGWMGIGFGTKMAGSDMVIVWPNSDGSYTLSQREGTGHEMPQVTANPSRIASLSTSQSFSNSSGSSITFTMPSSSSGDLNSTNLIWAYSDQKPEGSGSSANMAQHSNMGSTTLALLTPLNNAATSGGTNGQGQTEGQGVVTDASDNDDNGGGPKKKKPRNILIAHVVCGALALMLFLPLGILLPRYARGLTIKRWWFPLHGAINGILGGGLVIVAYATATSSLGDGSGIHPNLGLAILILIIIQIILGLSVHTLKRILPIKMHDKTGRTAFNYLHLILGIALVALGWVQTYTGLVMEWPQAVATGPASNGWKIGWAVVVGVVAVAYLAGFALLPRQLKMEKARNEAVRVESPTEGGRVQEKRRRWGRGANTA